MPEFRMPQTAAEWAAVEMNKTDQRAEARWRKDCPADYLCYVQLAAAARLLERERCVAALAVHLFDGSESVSVAQDEARRILDAPLPAPLEGDR